MLPVTRAMRMPWLHAWSSQIFSKSDNKKRPVCGTPLQTRDSWGGVGCLKGRGYGVRLAFGSETRSGLGQGPLWRWLQQRRGPVDRRSKEGNRAVWDTPGFWGLDLPISVAFNPSICHKNITLPTTCGINWLGLSFLILRPLMQVQASFWDSVVAT